MNGLVIAAARMVPLALLAPLGPPSVRLVVGVGLALIVALAGAPSMLDPVAGGALAVLLVREVALGTALGLAALALVLAAELAGALLDSVRGSQVARRPESQGMQLFGQLLALALFAALGGPLLLVDAVGRSYQLLPALGVAATPTPAAALAIGARLFGITVELVAPVLVVTLLADLALGLVRRAVPSLTGGPGAPGGAAAREILVLGGALACSGALVAALSSRVLGVGEAVAAAARAIGGGT